MRSTNHEHNVGAIIKTHYLRVIISGSEQQATRDEHKKQIVYRNSILNKTIISLLS
jgi:hypothetical protein